jgi:hypothetical protein
MAAVLTLILLPTLIALGSILSGLGAGLDELLITAFVSALFIGAFYGTVRLVADLEGPEPDAKHTR